MTTSSYIAIDNPQWVSVPTAIEAMCSYYKLPQLTGGSGRGWSSYATFARCPYSYYLRYIAKIQPEGLLGGEGPSDARDIGSLDHAFLAIQYRAAFEQKTPTVDEVFTFLKESKFQVNPAPLWKAWEVYQAYRQTYDADYLEPLAVEYPARDPRTGNTCRYDCVARIGNKAPEGIKPGIYIIEHKTAARFSEEVLDGWDLDGEILGEMALWTRGGAQRTFGKLTGLCVNILGKQKIPMFHRTFISPLSVRTKGHMKNLDYLAKLMKDCEMKRRWPQFSTGCVGRYGKCDYWTHCLNRGIQ